MSQRIIVDGAPLPFEPNDTLATAIVRAGHHPGNGGTLCLSGDCGACSVLLDGRVTCSCLVFAPEAEGATITTVEGLADGDHLHPLQECFLEGAALQCGVCTPGFLVAAKALLDENPNPTETQVRFGLAGNLCRCTGYDKIVRAVLEAAAQMREANV